MTQRAARSRRATASWPLRLGVLQRRHAVAVGDRRVRAGPQQDPDDLLVRRSSVAEDHSLQQCGPAEVVDVVHVDAGADDAAHVADVAALGGRDHRDAAEPVADPQVGPRRQQRLEHLDAAGHPGDQPGSVVLVVERVGVGSERDQQSGDRRPGRAPAASSSGVRCRASRASRSAPARSASAARSASPARPPRSSTSAARDRGRPHARPVAAAARSRRSLGCGMLHRRQPGRAGDGIADVDSGGDQHPHGVDVPRAPSPSMIASCSAVQPSRLTWSRSTPARTSRPATSAWPRSAARIRPVPLKSPWRSLAHRGEGSSSSRRYPSLVAIR